MIKCGICGKGRGGIITGDPLGEWIVEGDDHTHAPVRIKMQDVETGFWKKRELALWEREDGYVGIMMDGQREPVRRESTGPWVTWAEAHGPAARQQVAVPAPLTPEELTRAGQQALARLQAEGHVFDEKELAELTSQLRRDLAGADLPLPASKPVGASELIRGIALGCVFFAIFAIFVCGLALLL